MMETMMAENIRFKDHFTPLSGAYADFRPSYPAALFEYLANLASGRDLAWDCACGSGQASLDLAAHFDRVCATDASAAQLAAAPPHERIEYRLAAAESSGLADSSVDLITVAQALHWFDRPRFYAEVHRVLKPGGLLAVWTYGVQTLDDAKIHAAVQHFYREVVGPYWPPERVLVEQGYRGLDFPFVEIAAPACTMSEHWSLTRLLGYFRSWSATGRYIAAMGRDPVDDLGEILAPLWGNQERTIHWPLSIRLGKTTSREETHGNPTAHG